jgi:hypothetical protein
MVGLHAELMSRVGSPPSPAVMLDTTYGFQENAEQLSAKIRRYFNTRVRRPIELATLREVDAMESIALERCYKQLRDARYVFAGPGSPSYTLRQWRRSLIPTLLAERLGVAGCLTLASAAAMTVGRLAVPVYEIYKVGEAPHWIDGLDLLGTLAPNLAVITHYDNQEGGTHDTRYCYLGERRLRRLEEQAPSAVILGVAEHTAAVIDLDAGSLTVRGRAFVALRQHGRERRFAAGETIPLSLLGSTSGRTADAESIARAEASTDELANLRHDFGAALERGAFEEAAGVLLAIDDRLTRTADGEAETARSSFRGLLLELGRAAERGAISREPLEQIVEITVRLREQAREDRRYSEADRLREALQGLGIELRDTPIGAEWSRPS